MNKSIRKKLNKIASEKDYARALETNKILLDLVGSMEMKLLKYNQIFSLLGKLHRQINDLKRANNNINKLDKSYYEAVNRFFCY